MPLKDNKKEYSAAAKYKRPRFRHTQRYCCYLLASHCIAVGAGHDVKTRREPRGEMDVRDYPPSSDLLLFQVLVIPCRTYILTS